MFHPKKSVSTHFAGERQSKKITLQEALAFLCSISVMVLTCYVGLAAQTCVRPVVILCILRGSFGFTDTLHSRQTGKFPASNCHRLVLASWVSWQLPECSLVLIILVTHRQRYWWNIQSVHIYEVIVTWRTPSSYVCLIARLVHMMVNCWMFANHQNFQVKACTHKWVFRLTNGKLLPPPLML